VTVSICERDGVARLAVTDDGPGFPPEFLPVAFDRFTRADDARGRTVPDRVAAGGTGLGLAIVRSIAERHGGHAVAANRPGGGAEVTLCWPL
jgi:signal transduction histidine kinase